MIVDSNWNFFITEFKSLLFIKKKFFFRIDNFLSEENKL